MTTSASAPLIKSTTPAPTMPPLLTQDPALLAVRAPAVFAIFHQAWAAVQRTFDSATIDIVHARTLNLLTGTSYESDSDEEALTALVDQFVDYVPEVDEGLLAPVRAFYGENRIRDVLEALYVVDQLTRLYVTHSKLFGALSTTPPDAALLDLPSLELQAAASIWHDKALELKNLDTETAEVARLRGAFYHTCRMCMTVRVVEDGVVVAPPSLVDAVREDRTAELSARHRTAIRYADAHMVDPRLLDDNLADALHKEFTDDELVELTLDMTAWNHQKVAVPLKTDKPFRSGELTALLIATDGTVKFGRSLGPS